MGKPRNTNPNLIPLTSSNNSNVQNRNSNYVSQYYGGSSFPSSSTINRSLGPPEDWAQSSKLNFNDLSHSSNTVKRSDMYSLSNNVFPGTSDVRGVPPGPSHYNRSVADNSAVVTKDLNIDDFGDMDSDDEDDTPFRFQQEVHHNIDGVPISDSILSFIDPNKSVKKPQYSQSQSSQLDHSDDPAISMQDFINALKDPESLIRKSRSEMHSPVSSLVKDENVLSGGFVDPMSSYRRNASASLKHTSSSMKGKFVKPDHSPNGNESERTPFGQGKKHPKEEPSKKLSKVSKKDANRVNTVKLAWHKTPVDRRKGEFATQNIVKRQLANVQLPDSITIPETSSQSPMNFYPAEVEFAAPAPSMTPIAVQDAIRNGKIEVMKKFAPDGNGTVRYPAPDTSVLIFDPELGFRYDPQTGLHYDANSGYFFNSKLRIFLYWDLFSQTYLKVQNPTIPFPVLQNQKVLPSVAQNDNTDGAIIDMKKLLAQHRQIKLEQYRQNQDTSSRASTNDGGNRKRGASPDRNSEIKRWFASKSPVRTTSASKGSTHFRKSNSPTPRKPRKTDDRRRLSPSPRRCLDSPGHGTSRRRRSGSPPIDKRRSSPSPKRRLDSPGHVTSRRRRSGSPPIDKRRSSPSPKRRSNFPEHVASGRRRSGSPPIDKRRSSPSPKRHLDYSGHVTSRRRRSDSPPINKRRSSPSPKRCLDSPGPVTSRRRRSGSPPIDKRRTSLSPKRHSDYPGHVASGRRRSGSPPIDKRRSSPSPKRHLDYPGHVTSRSRRSASPPIDKRRSSPSPKRHLDYPGHVASGRRRSGSPISRIHASKQSSRRRSRSRSPGPLKRRSISPAERIRRERERLRIGSPDRRRQFPRSPLRKRSNSKSPLRLQFEKETLRRRSRSPINIGRRSVSKSPLGRRSRSLSPSRAFRRSSPKMGSHSKTREQSRKKSRTPDGKSREQNRKKSETPGRKSEQNRRRSRTPDRKSREQNRKKSRTPDRKSREQNRKKSRTPARISRMRDHEDSHPTLTVTVLNPSAQGKSTENRSAQKTSSLDRTKNEQKRKHYDRKSESFSGRENKKSDEKSRIHRSDAMHDVKKSGEYSKKKDDSSTNDGRNHRLVNQRQFSGSGTKSSSLTGATIMSELSASSQLYSSLLPVSVEDNVEQINITSSVPDDLSDFVVLDGIGEDEDDNMTEEALQLLLDGDDDAKNVDDDSKSGEVNAVAANTSSVSVIDQSHQKDDEGSTTAVPSSQLENLASIGDRNHGRINTSDESKELCVQKDESIVSDQNVVPKSNKKSLLKSSTPYSQPPSPASSIYSSYNFSDDDNFVTVNTVRDEEASTDDTREKENTESSTANRVGEFEDQSTEAGPTSNDIPSKMVDETASATSDVSKDVLQTAELSHCTVGSSSSTVSTQKPENKAVHGVEESALISQSVRTEETSTKSEVELSRCTGNSSSSIVETTDSIQKPETKVVDEVVESTLISQNVVTKELKIESDIQDNQKQENHSEGNNQLDCTKNLMKNGAVEDTVATQSVVEPSPATTKETVKNDPIHSKSAVRQCDNTNTDSSSIAQVENVSGQDDQINDGSVKTEDKILNDAKTTRDVFSRLGEPTVEQAKTDYRVPGDTDPLSSFFSNTPSSFVQLKTSPNAIPCESQVLKKSLYQHLVHEGIDFQTITVVTKNNFGCPYPFIKVIFETVSQAIEWFLKTKRKVILQHTSRVKKTYYLYYDTKPWRCKNCFSFNIFFRFLCCLCYSRKDGSPSVVRVSQRPTKCIGLFKLPASVNEKNVREHIPEVLRKCSMKRVTIVVDPHMQLCCGLVVIELTLMKEAKSVEYLSQLDSNIKYVELDQTPDSSILCDAMFGDSLDAKGAGSSREQHDMKQPAKLADRKSVQSRRQVENEGLFQNRRERRSDVTGDINDEIGDSEYLEEYDRLILSDDEMDPNGRIVKYSRGHSSQERPNYRRLSPTHQESSDPRDYDDRYREEDDQYHNRDSERSSFHSSRPSFSPQNRRFEQVYQPSNRLVSSHQSFSPQRRITALRRSPPNRGNSPHSRLSASDALLPTPTQLPKPDGRYNRLKYPTPDTSKFRLLRDSDLLYDPETALLYNPITQLFLNDDLNIHLVYDYAIRRYLPFK